MGFFSFLKRSTPSRLRVSPGTLQDIIRRDLGAHFGAGNKIRLADVGYASVSQSEAEKFVSAASSYWTVEINDCDNQAWMAKAAAIKAQFSLGVPLAFGVVWTEDHALNWYLTHEGRVRLIDQPGASDRLTPITLVLA